ncbi:LysR family transcriptional regulator [Aquincola tertiaricarbonis]|uniref:LysR family transcriptional regulator n=1 Tax=Aquincola tertiaricarbonis TaxID=391953 RepID=UPI00061521F4|nr:LysR family transcriptional regulator [Aquincola tertiaricarbonis]
MDIKQVEYFIQVAQLGSFSRAAEALGMTQPALSRQVRSLEVELRETLLLRNGRGVALTEPGRRLLERGREIVRLVQTTEQELGAMRGEPEGQIVVGLPPSLARHLTVALIERFQAEMPKARVAIVEGFSSHITEWLGSGRVDLGLVYNPEPMPNLEQQPILREELCLVGPPSTSLRAAITLADVSRLPLVLPQRGHSFRRLMEREALLAGVKLQVAWEVSSVPTILDMVRRGHGYAALTASAVNEGNGADALTRTVIVEPRIRSTLCIAWSSATRRDALQVRSAELLSELARGFAA